MNNTLTLRYCCTKQSKHHGVVTSNKSAGAIDRFQVLSWRDDIRITVVYGPYVKDYFLG
jgi:hypothetical protein